MKNHNKTPVGQLGLDLWCQHVIRRPSIQSKLLSTLLGMIHMERVGEVASRGLVRETTQVCIAAHRQIDFIISLVLVRLAPPDSLGIIHAYN